MNFPAQLNMAALLLQLLIAAVSGSILGMPAAAEVDATGMSTTAASLSASLDRSRLYLGETTTITVILQRGNAAVRNIHYPVVSTSGVTIGEFALPRHKETQQDGTAVVRDEFIATVTPQKSGVTRLGPVRIDLEQLAPAGGSAGFFGETTPTPISLSAKPLDLQVLPLPTNGRPADFSGAVGRFRFTVTAKPTDVRLGNPVTVSSIISGVGNLASVKCPDLISPDIKNYPPQARLSSAALQCEQIIVPITAGMKTLPQLRFTFFDPVSARYRTLLSEAVPLTIIDETSKDVVSDVPVVQKSVSAARQQFWPSFLFPFFIGVIAVVSTVVFVRRRRTNRPTIHQQPGASSTLHVLLKTAEQALSNNDVELFYNNVFRATEKIASGLWKDSIPWCEDRLISTASDTDTQGSYQKIAVLNKLVASCDAVRYGCHKPKHEEMQEIYSQLKTLCRD